MQGQFVQNAFQESGLMLDVELNEKKKKKACFPFSFFL